MEQVIFIKTVFSRICQLSKERIGKKNKIDRSFKIYNDEIVGYGILPPYYMIRGASEEFKNCYQPGVNNNNNNSGNKLTGQMYLSEREVDKTLFTEAFSEYLENATKLYNWNFRQRAYQSAIFLLVSCEKDIRRIISTTLVGNSFNVEKNIDYYKICTHFLNIIPSGLDIDNVKEKPHLPFELYYQQKLTVIIPFILGKYLLHVRKLMIVTGHLMTDEECENVWKKFRQIISHLDVISDFRQYHSLFKIETVDRGEDQNVKIENVAKIKNLFRLSTNLLGPIVNIILLYTGVEATDDEVELYLHTHSFFLQDSFPNINYKLLKKFDQK
jgi:hypothetical protein